ncbi:hypothetical protein AB0K51_07245 [Kitasatospora sp. NPDC049285]|uniref:hypothetical protein n=1 Tax=Kitasatospora sp. NPDC049285 TaxID=3157096 RepID=UPI0034239EC8
MKDLQNGLTALLPSALGVQVRAEACPAWLVRPGRVECAGRWPAVAVIYRALTGLALPDLAPPREHRRLDVLLTHPDGRQQVLEVDERQHFTGARAVSLAHYPSDAVLGFDAARWSRRARELTGREPGGGFAPGPASAVSRRGRPAPAAGLPGCAGRSAARGARLAADAADR